jgi:RimK family alpha-L-glutamate ligase
MKFWALRPSLNPDVELRRKLLKNACDHRNIEYIDVDQDKFDYSNIPELDYGDMLFHIIRGPNLLERLMVNERVATFYQHHNTVMARPDQMIVHEKAGLPVPRTIHSVSRDRGLLKKYVDALGGFPIIVKAAGGSNGIGVMKVDSISSLYSIVDYVSKNGKIVLREFIDSGGTHARLIVVGKKVVDSIEYRARNDDFRSNESETPNVRPMKFSKEVEATALKATEVMGVEFAGVDIMLGENNAHYVTEINFPCNFARVQMSTGHDVAGEIVDYLIQKAKRLSSTESLTHKKEELCLA